MVVSKAAVINVMSNQFDRHPFDDALTHNTQLKVGDLGTPCEACEDKERQIIRYKHALIVIQYLCKDPNYWCDTSSMVFQEVLRTLKQVL